MASATGAGAVVAAAQHMIGTPYRFAGASARGIDCSGLTMLAWKAGGVTLPHNAAAQYAIVSKRALNNAVPGDIVFFGLPPHHCGIYIGGGQMIDAQQNGVPVQVHSIKQSDVQNRVGAFPGSSPAAVTAGAGVKSTAQTIYEFLVGSLGLSGAQAAGALGNLQTESGFSTTAHNANENAIGLAQWEGGRRARLQAYAAQNGGKETDLRIQLGFMASELRGPYSGVLARLRATNTPAAAATVWDASYEVSTGTTRTDRIANAQSIYGQIQSGKALSGGDTANFVSAGGGNSGPSVGDIILGPAGAAVGGAQSVVNSVVGVVVKIAFTGLGLTMIAIGGAATIRQQAIGAMA